MTVTTHKIGKVRMNPRGAWSSTSSYEKLDIAIRKGSAYYCKIDDTGSDPLTSPDVWILMVKSTVGPVGAKGDQGVVGPIGPEGIFTNLGIKGDLVAQTPILSTLHTGPIVTSAWTVQDGTGITKHMKGPSHFIKIPTIRPNDSIMGILFQSTVNDIIIDELFLPWGPISGIADIEPELVPRIFFSADFSKDVYVGYEDRNSLIIYSGTASALPANSRLNLYWAVNKGITGPVGPIGLTGPVGPVGPIGPIGLRGLRGLIGLTGNVYLGSKSSEPSLDNDGNPLVDGALFYDNSIEVMKIYDLSLMQWRQLTTTRPDQSNINTVAADEEDIGVVAGLAADIRALAAGTLSLTEFSITDATDVPRLGSAGQALVVNRSANAMEFSDIARPLPEIYGFDVSNRGVLQLTTTRGGADNISKTLYATFDEVLYARTGFVFYIDVNGDLIMRI